MAKLVAGGDAQIWQLDVARTPVKRCSRSELASAPRNPKIQDGANTRKRIEGTDRSFLHVSWTAQQGF